MLLAKISGFRPFNSTQGQATYPHVFCPDSPYNLTTQRFCSSFPAIKLKPGDLRQAGPLFL